MSKVLSGPSEPWRWGGGLVAVNFLYNSVLTEKE